MEWIESIQKIAPWAGSLPVLHKVALSTVIFGIGALCLLLIWLPAPAPEKKPATSNPATPLNIFVDSSGAAAEAAAKFAYLLENKSAKAKVESDIEKEKLKDVIRGLVTIEYSQAPLPWLLRNYAQSEDPKNWQQVTSVIATNTPIISELVDVLGSFDGDLIYKDMETYKQLRFMMNSRAGLYHQLANMKPPKSKIEKEQLLKIADNFEALINQMKLIQSKLGKYLNNDED